jgi:hypothetical protein
MDVKGLVQKLKNFPQNIEVIELLETRGQALFFVYYIEWSAVQREKWKATKDEP